LAGLQVTLGVHPPPSTEPSGRIAIPVSTTPLSTAGGTAVGTSATLPSLESVGCRLLTRAQVAGPARKTARTAAVRPDRGT
jgi:hypothetical protein